MKCHIFFPDKFWKLNKENKLINKEWYRKELDEGVHLDWKYGNQEWNIPREGQIGFIEVQNSDQVLGVSGPNTAMSEVDLQKKNNSSSFNQKWLRGKGRDFSFFEEVQEVWFTLQIPSSGLYLSVDLIANLTIKGLYTEGVS